MANPQPLRTIGLTLAAGFAWKSKAADTTQVLDSFSKKPANDRGIPFPFSHCYERASMPQPFSPFFFDRIRPRPGLAVLEESFVNQIGAGARP
jgi:hypothetical protein